MILDRFYGLCSCISIQKTPIVIGAKVHTVTFVGLSFKVDSRKSGF